ncbi:MAG: hypothetical protein K0Q53_285 [Massilibacillus sp.]|jgi:hypothetical protein|nr:hypothetical protein [Massilibacillus sp.]
MAVNKLEYIYIIGSTEKKMKLIINFVYLALEEQQKTINKVEKVSIKINLYSPKWVL